jgi:hypothetical protein
MTAPTVPAPHGPLNGPAGALSAQPGPVGAHPTGALPGLSTTPSTGGANPAAMASGDPLADLHGYHLPDPVSWWPPAPGWWLLMLLGLCLLGVLTWWLVRRYRHEAAGRAAQAELLVLRAALTQDGDTAVFVRGLSRLLKRLALVRFPRRAVAGLSGEDWLAFLDAEGGAGRFRSGPGRLLLDAPYRPPQDLPVAELASLVEDWIRCHRRPGGRQS